VTAQPVGAGLGLVKGYGEEGSVMSQQSVRQAARRSALDAQAVWRKNGPTGNAGSVRHEVARDEWTHRLEVRLMSKV
jgi:hypothetical protein